jgi:hypothetical protein
MEGHWPTVASEEGFHRTEWPLPPFRNGLRTQVRYDENDLLTESVGPVSEMMAQNLLHDSLYGWVSLEH